MKLESLVIADQQAAVNTFSGLVHNSCVRSRILRVWQLRKPIGLNPIPAYGGIAKKILADLIP